MESSIQSGKVREVARIRGLREQNLAKAPCISISGQKLQGKSSVVISFSEQSTSSKPFNYEVDHCYDHAASNDVVFSEEIKPLISSVFEGKSATVFAYGARGSGKTYTIQGSENVPGLISLSMSEFVSRAEELGNSVSISLYEVLQDHVFDLLDSKKLEIQVLEGAHGKIVLKGLSKATIKSISEFHKLWSAILQRPSQKMTNEPPQRSHRGMIINISSSLEDASLLGRMNIVDLAGYEDKRQSTNGANLLGISKINKSLYAVHNVLHALKSNEARVPYRESKLTRMLQESLGGMNMILMITCLDPLFPEDTIKTLSLAARSCQVVNTTKVDHTSRVKSLIKSNTTPTSSFKQNVTPASSFKQNVTHSSKPVKFASSSASTRKQVSSLLRSIEIKPQAVKVQGRSLFEELQSVNTKKRTVSKKYMEATETSREQEETMSKKNMEATETSTELEEKMSENNMEVTESSREQKEKMCAIKVPQPSLAVSANEVSSLMEKTGVYTPSIVQPDSEVPSEEGQNSSVNVTQPSLVVSANETGVNTPSIVQPVSGVSNEQNNPQVSQTPADHQNLVTPDVVEADKENKSSAMNDVASPPLSARLQELSNHLKSLYTSTPLNINTELENYNSSIKANDKSGDDVLEPTTPISQPTINANSKSQHKSLMSPWERLQERSTGMKAVLVKECLKFLNSASKEELKGLKGIGDARATYILQWRDESPEPFKSLEDLKEIGLSSKQIKGMVKNVTDGLFD